MADSEEKRDEVSQLYASMTDAELKRLADEAWSLTELGREVLLAELGRRGLAFELAATPSVEVRSGGLVAVSRFRDLPDALLAQTFLESAGMESFLIDNNTIRMDWLWSNLVGGVKLCVKPEDADAAAQLLRQKIPEEFGVEGVGNFKQPQCPQCQSFDISFEDLNKPVTYGSFLIVGFPVPVSRRQWKCQSCGHVWQPNEEESTQAQ